MSKKPDFADVHGEESNAPSKKESPQTLDFTGFATFLLFTKVYIFSQNLRHFGVKLAYGDLVGWWGFYYKTV